MFGIIAHVLCRYLRINVFYFINGLNGVTVVFSHLFLNHFELQIKISLVFVNLRYIALFNLYEMSGNNNDNKKKVNTILTFTL